MKNTENIMRRHGIQQLAIAGVLLALGACASDTPMTGSDSTASTTSGTSTGTGTGSGSTSSAGTGSAGSMAGTGTTATGSGADATAMWRGVVVAIEPMTRQDAMMASSGSVGAAAAGGAVGAGQPTDRVYRVTLRADDGTSQTVVVDTQPSYQTGDRIRYNNGAVMRDQ